MGPCVVTQLKSNDVDGYEAVQIGFGEKKNAISPASGHAAKANTTAKSKYVEFREFGTPVSLGEVLTVAMFAEGEFVDIVGQSKGKGFQGVVRRHGFSGVGESTHGQHNRGRAPGSIGAGSDPSRVFKGMRMGGRMGNTRIKIQNLQILKVDAEKNLLVVKGSIPGAKQSLVIVER